MSNLKSTKTDREQLTKLSSSARLTGLPYRTLYDAAKRGDFPHTLIGEDGSQNAMYIYMSDVWAWIDSRRETGE